MPTPPPKDTAWLFGSDDEEDGQIPLNNSNQVVSVLTRRVPGGTLRKTAKRTGELLAELRVYNTEEVRNLEGLDRCNKAVVWLRLQGDRGSAEFESLQKFVQLAKAKFKEEGTFFVEKKKK